MASPLEMPAWYIGTSPSHGVNYQIVRVQRNFMNGVLVVDKPAGLTSHDVVHRVRRALQQRAVGHVGTLDPMATGVLPLVIGNLTRLAQFYLASEKSYEGVIRFGFSTDTYDVEGDATSAPQHVGLSLDQVREIASRFQGRLEQMPPLARKHKPIELRPVQVELKEFDIVGVERDRAIFRARVAPGTYMRSVAHDMGQALGCGAHLESLRRTATGEFTLADSHTLDQIENAAPNGRIEELFIHPRKLLPQLPAVSANAEAAACILHGRAVNLPELSQAPLVKVFHGQRELIAIVSRIAGTLFHPKIVFAAEAQHLVSR